MESYTGGKARFSQYRSGAWSRSGLTARRIIPASSRALAAAPTPAYAGASEHGVPGSDWQPGSRLVYCGNKGGVAIEGTVLDTEPPAIGGG